MDTLQDNVRRASVILKAMANERRLMILTFLAKEKELSVSALEERIDLSQSALSQHLARLRRDDIVKTQRNRQSIIYSLNSAEAEVIMEALERAYASAAGKPAAMTASADPVAIAAE